MKIDVVLGLQYGDEGKGKICYDWARKKSYTHCIRFSGGGNAGHTIYHNNKKFVTHLVPVGIFHGIKSIIGPGCVLNVDKFLEEIKYLNDNGIRTEGLVFIAKNAHIVTPDHVLDDSTDSRIGTTKTGNGPAYSDKYARTGRRAESEPLLQKYLIDMYSEFYTRNDVFSVLAEGAQAFGLDIDWGDYPYVTSSHCGIGSVMLNGFNYKQIRDVYGVIKAYDTYVGAKKFQPDDPIFSRVQELGKEFGATTGRKRQCNWMNWNLVAQAIKMNGVNKLIVNKVDVLEELGTWKIYNEKDLLSFTNREDFQRWVSKAASRIGAVTYFSDNPFVCDEFQETVSAFSDFDDKSNYKMIDRFF